MALDPPTTDNHDLPLIPPIGETNASDYKDQWGSILNDSTFTPLDKKLIIRDTDANKSNYTPHQDAQYWATDTGTVYTGDGSSWNAEDADFGSLSVSGNSVATETWATGSNISHGDLSNAPSSAHHSKYTDSEAVSAVNAETSLSVDIGGDADTVDGSHADDLARPKNVAVLTSTNTSLDINQTTWQQIPWDNQLQVDTDYTHDPSGSPEQITFDVGGTYRVKAMLTYESTGATRVNPGIKFSINGTRRNAVGLSGYIRHASGHDEASNYLEETITVNAGDTLRVETYEYGNNGTVYLRANESQLIIEQVSETVAHGDDADTVDGKHAADFVLESGDTMTGELTLDAGASVNSTLEMNDNQVQNLTLQNVNSVEMDGTIAGGGYDMSIREVTQIRGPNNGDTDLTLETNGSGSDSISLYDGNGTQDILVANEGGSVDVPNGNINITGPNNIALNLDNTDVSSRIQLLHSSGGVGLGSDAFGIRNSDLGDNLLRIEADGSGASFNSSLSTDGDLDVSNGGVNIGSVGTLASTGDLSLTGEIHLTNSATKITRKSTSVGSSAVQVKGHSGVTLYANNTDDELLNAYDTGNVSIPNGNLEMGSNSVQTDNFEIEENSSTNSLDFNYTGS